MFVSKAASLFCSSFKMHIKAAGVFVAGGFRCGVYSATWHLWYNGARVIDYSGHSTDCFTLISFWPYRVRDYINSWEDDRWGNGMFLIYCPIITGLSRRTGRGGGGGLQKYRERGTERGREGLINKGGEWKRARGTEYCWGARRAKNCHLNSDVLFYLRWQVCRGPQPRAVPLWPVPTGCVAHLKIRP